MTTATPHPAVAVAEYVDRTIGRLSALLRAQVGGAVAELAALRQAAGAPVGADPDTWALVLGLPDALRGSGDVPNAAEKAVHYSLTTWALHQRAKSDPMHSRERTFASAVAMLARSQNEDSFSAPAFSRFRSATSASDVGTLITHSRGIIAQLRGPGISFDYAKFAADLYRFDTHSGRESVRLTWGREFSRTPRVGSDSPPLSEPSPV